MVVSGGERKGEQRDGEEGEWDPAATAAAALQWYTDPHSQVLFTVVITLSLPRRLVISLPSSLVGVILTVDEIPGMQISKFYLLLLL